MEYIKNYDVKYNLRKSTKDVEFQDFSNTIALEVLRFHRTIPVYKETPLVDLQALSHKWSVKHIFVKDESFRFGLNAFKALGGSYAIAKILYNYLGIEYKNMDFSSLMELLDKGKKPPLTFVTATDGNHGRGIAWAANLLKQKAIVYMPAFTATARVENIKKLGAEVFVTDLNYDDTVRLAKKKAEENKWIIVQDTAWQGYYDIPTWVMQGYLTMLTESLEQLKQYNKFNILTHVIIQAGVGAMAGAIVGLLVSTFKEKCPFIIIVEPDNAACLFESSLSSDGNPKIVKGDLKTIMAGLACGEPNPIGWNVLKKSVDCFMSLPDFVAANGMRILSSPYKDDTRIIAGESGAIGIGVLDLIMNVKEFSELKKTLHFDDTSSVLLFNTEGATDPVNYEHVVWYGKYPDKYK